jgi:hypothetical protein
LQLCGRKITSQSFEIVRQAVGLLKILPIKGLADFKFITMAAIREINT